MKLKTITPLGLLVAILMITSQITGQIGIPSLDQKNLSYKQLLKQAEEINSIALVVAYTDAIPSKVIPRITGIDTIISNNKLVTDVIDPYKQVNYPLIRRARPFNNPMWMTVHSNNTIIGMSSSIVSNADLSKFVRRSQLIAAKHDKAQQLLQVNKNDMEAKKQLIEAIAVMYESKKAQKHINKYIGQIDKPTKSELEFIFKIAESCACGSKLEKFIKKNANAIQNIIPSNRYLRLQNKFIDTDLEEKGMLEPFYVWQAYEKNLGVHADSLYRLFAIKYFAAIPGETPAMINESIDFLAAYPNSPWELQDPLYKVILNNISKKEDLELMLDLISGQIYKGENFRKLDFRATLLYRLGKEEQALKMINRISELALKEGIRYKSMIYGLKK